MKIVYEVKGVKVTLEVDENEIFDYEGGLERELTHYLLRHELTTILQGFAHQVSGTLHMGTLATVMFSILRSKLVEASHELLHQIKGLEEGKDPMELLSEYLLAEISEERLESGSFSGFIESDLDFDEEK